MYYVTLGSLSAEVMRQPGPGVCSRCGAGHHHMHHSVPSCSLAGVPPADVVLAPEHPDPFIKREQQKAEIKDL